MEKGQEISFFFSPLLLVHCCFPSLSNFASRKGIQQIFASGIQNLGKFAGGIRNPRPWNPESH